MRYCWCVLLLLASFACQAQRKYIVDGGRIAFRSEAPQELIKASSSKLTGIVDVSSQTFAFKMPINSFQGFNSPLQQEHFHENYMETKSYPEATFSGKIIGNLDLNQDGTYNIRAKGRLNIHGTTAERLIPVTITVQKDKIGFSSDFTIPLEAHAIKIPRLVYEKLAPEIKVSVDAKLVPHS